jgi:hypothetical protein
MDCRTDSAQVRLDVNRPGSIGRKPHSIPISLFALLILSHRVESP